MERFFEKIFDRAAKTWYDIGTNKNKIAYNEIEAAVFISTAPKGKGLPDAGAEKGQPPKEKSVRVAFVPGFAVNNCKTVIPQVMESYRDEKWETVYSRSAAVGRFLYRVAKSMQP